MASESRGDDARVPLLDYSSSTVRSKYKGGDEEDLSLTWRVWIESKKLWHIVGPSMVSRIASYSMFVIAQAFAGHLGDHELAAVSIASTVVLGLNFGLLVLLLLLYSFSHRIFVLTCGSVQLSFSFLETQNNVLKLKKVYLKYYYQTFYFYFYILIKLNY